MRALSFILCLWTACTVQAQSEASARLNQFRPAETPLGGFQLSAARGPRHLGVAAQTSFDYAHDPLVFENARGMSDTESVALVSDQLTANLGVALGLFDVVTVFASLPLNLMMKGERLGSQPTATGFGAGDLAGGARFQFHDDPKWASALQLTATAPTGESGEGAPSVAGDAGATVQIEALSDADVDALRLSANVGVRVVQDQSFGGAEFSDVLTFGLGISLPLLQERLSPRIELVGQSPLDDLGQRDSTPLEAALGAVWLVTPDLRVGGSMGAGLLRGYGSPDVRATLDVGFMPAAVRPRAGARRAVTPPDEGAVDEDADTEPTSETSASTTGDSQLAEPSAATAESAMADADGDAIRDLDDRCPNTPGRAAELGCARYLEYDSASGAVRLLRPLSFGTGGRPEPRSTPLIDEVAAFFNANPSWRFRLETHTMRQTGVSSALQTQISMERALALLAALQARGVAPQQVEAFGCGVSRPLTKSRLRRSKNDRVEVYRSDARAGTSGASQGCSRAVSGRAPPATPRASQARPAAHELAPAVQTKDATAALLSGAALRSTLRNNPSGDHDGDGVPNRRDRCPLSPGRGKAGCPSHHRVDLEHASIVLDMGVMFLGRGARVHRRSQRHLRALVDTLEANPSFRISIEAHVAAKGDPAQALDLTQRRAAAVREVLTEAGADPTRIEGFGCGDLHPLARDTERVELRLIAPDAPAGLPTRPNCKPSR